MTEEIEEILNYIDDRIIPNEKWDKIKDYITNLQQLYENALKVNQNENKYRTALESKYVLLQQENEFLKLNNLEMNIEHFRVVKENKRKIDNLRKENERLNNKIKEQNLLLIEFQDMEQKLDIYKSRCKKAIYYIWKEIEQEYDEENDKWLKEKIDNLSNILNGSDEK